jgi:hypothetical protein
MRKKDSLDDYEVFYMELPKADYMDDIEIVDEYDNHAYDQVQGLSDEQVSEIARDSLDAAKRQSDAGSDNASPATDQT